MEENLGDLGAILRLKTDPADIAAAQQQLNAIFGTAQSGINAINEGIAKIQRITSLGILGGGLAGIVSQVFQTRSYFQDAASSMKTFLGDAEKAAKFTKELQDYAFYNMFEFSDLVGVSKQLIAYGTTDTKEIIRVTDQLSNIATGTGANINDMVNIYNKIKAQGKLQGDELNQLASRGLVVKDVLKEMGETVNGNNVSFEQFQKVLTHVTSEGGMFHDLMKDQLNNLSASAAQLSDNLTSLWNSVGESLEPVMKEAIDLAGLLIEKGAEGFENVQAYLFDIAKAYGIYKVVEAGMTWNAENKEQERVRSVEKLTSALEEAEEATKNVENADLQAAVKKKKLTAQEAAEVSELRKRIAEENKAKIASGELTKEEAKKIATATEGLKMREIELKKVKQQADEEVAAIDKEIAALEKKKQVQDSLLLTAHNNKDYSSADKAETSIKEIQAQKNTLALARQAAAERQLAATTGISTIQQAQNTAALAQNTAARNVFSRAATAAGAALKGIGSSIVEMINPMGLLISAVTFLAEHLWEVYQAGSATEQAQKRLREAQDEAEKQTLEEMQKLGEYAQIIRQTKEDTEAFKDAKQGLWDMANKLNIQTTETVNGIKQEMSAIDLVNKKYDEYKEKIRQVANEQAYQSFIKNEKQAITEQITDVTSYLREEMENTLLDGLKGDELGAKRAEIAAAVSDIGIQLLEGNTMLTGRTKEIYDEYVGKIGDDWKKYWVTLKREIHGIDDKISGDGDLHERQEGESLSEYATRTAKGYGAYLMERARTQIDASNAAIIQAKKTFNIHDEDKKSDEKDQKGNKSPLTQKILKAKEEAKKYIEEYAKISEERRKALRKIDLDASLDDEQRQAKKDKVEINATQQFEELAANYEHFTKKIKGAKFTEQIFDNYGFGVDTENKDLIRNLEAAYEYASNEEISIARAKKTQTVKEIADINKQIEKLQAKDEIDPKTGKVKQRTEQEESAINTTVNQMQQRIAILTAISEGYQTVINADKEWEKNYTRIHAITKQENEKFLDSQVKKQQDIKESYDKLRRELMIMFDDKQLTDEEYRKMSFQLDMNEEKERQQEYINIYGGYYAKRADLMQQWEQRLANIPPEYLTVAKEKMVEELSKMDFSRFKESLNWDAIFGDLSRKTSKTLVKNLEDLRAAYESEKGNMGIEEIKTVTEAIAKLDNELNKRNPWRAMVKSIKTMKETAKNLPNLIEKHEQAQKNLNAAVAEYKRITKELKDLQEQLNNANLTDAERADLQTQISNKIKEQGKALANVTEKEKAATQAQKELNEEQAKANQAPLDWIKGWQDVSKSIAEAGDALAQFDGKLGEIGSVLANIGSELQNAFSSIQSGDMFSTVSTAVTSIVGIVSTISNSRKKARQEEKDWALAQQRFADNMQLIEIQSTRLATKNKENIFGVRDYMGEAQDAVEAYKIAQNKLYAQIAKIDKDGKAKVGQRDGVDWNAVGKTTGKGAAAGAAIGTAVGGWALGLGTVIGGAIGAVGGFFSGLFGGKKKKDQWGGLLEQYPELVERAANGEERINMELAEQLIQQGIVNDETKEMLETAKSYQEEMDAAEEQISNIVSDLTGSLAQNLKNALVDAFVAGEDAAGAFKKTVDKMLEDMIADLMFTAAFQDLFDELGEKYKEIFRGKGTVEDIVNATNQFMDEGAARSQLFVDGLGAVQKAVKENGGHNLWSSEQDRQAVTGGIANVTQDTAEEMNGRLTQIQSHTFSINENMKIMVSMQTTQLAILQGIHTDTGELHTIRADIASVKEAVADIQVRGIKLK